MNLLDDFLIFVFDFLNLLFQVFEFLMQQNYLLRAVLVLRSLCDVDDPILVVIARWRVYLGLRGRWIEFVWLALERTHFARFKI